MSSLLCRDKILALALKKYAKTDTKVFRSCLNLLDIYFYSEYFEHDFRLRSTFDFLQITIKCINKITKRHLFWNLFHCVSYLLK